MTFVKLPRGGKAQAILWALCSGPGEMHGQELATETHSKPGSLLPALVRLIAGGWITSRRESTSQATAGRPPRVYYALTPEAADFLNPL